MCPFATEFATKNQLEIFATDKVSCKLVVANTPQIGQYYNL